MAIDLRSQIFQLRQAGVSHRGIAKQLGISSSKVARELAKRAPEVRSERGDLEDPTGDVDLSLPPLPPIQAGGDPLLAEERAALEREELALRRARLRSQRLEAERRVQLLENPESGQGNNGLIALVLQTMDRNREETRALIQQLIGRQTAPPVTPAPSFSEQLAQARQVMETAAAFAPAKAPSASTDLEFIVAKERLNLEGQDLAARREAELAERRERMISEQRRNDAVASAIEKFAPVASTAIQEWFASRSAKAPVYPPAPGDDGEPARPALVVAGGSTEELEGQCPNCGTPIAISGAQDEECPHCKRTLAVVAGRIRVRLGNGALYPPLPD